MLVEHTYEIVFERELVPQPIVCEMSRTFRNIMYNIDYLSVSKYEALLRISIVGEIDAVNAAEKFLRDTGVEMKLISAATFSGQIPQVPARTATMQSKEPAVHQKIWVTIVGPLRREPLFWVLSRRFDVTFNILQSTVGDPVSILCLDLWGPPVEIDGAVRFLREKGVDVEFGQTENKPQA